MENAQVWTQTYHHEFLYTTPENSDFSNSLGEEGNNKPVG
jgi:hypothetical protein